MKNLSDCWKGQYIFKSFDEAAKHVYDAILYQDLPERPLEVIKRDLIFMTNDDVSRTDYRYPILPRYVFLCTSGCEELLNNLIEWYGELGKRLGWGKINFT